MKVRGRANSLARWATAAAVLGAAASASGASRADEASLPREPALVRPVPPPPPPPVSRTYMNCVGCAIAGGAVLGAGALHALVGAVDLQDRGGDRDNGRVLLVLAGLHGLVGLPLLIAGVWPVERTGARAAQSMPAGPPEPPVDLAVGPLGGSLRVRF